jgi:hypothetical protein
MEMDAELNTDRRHLHALYPKRIRRRAIEKAMLAELELLSARLSKYVFSRERLDLLHAMSEIWLDLIDCELTDRRSQRIFRAYQAFLDAYDHREDMGKPIAPLATITPYRERSTLD